MSHIDQDDIIYRDNNHTYVVIYIVEQYCSYGIPKKKKMVINPIPGRPPQTMAERRSRACRFFVGREGRHYRGGSRSTTVAFIGSSRVADNNITTHHSCMFIDRMLYAYNITVI